MAPPSPKMNINTISYPIQLTGTMENSYPGARTRSAIPLPFDPLLYRTRHLSLARTNHPKRTRGSQDYGSTDVNEFIRNEMKSPEPLSTLDQASCESDYIPLLASTGILVENLEQEGLTKEEAKERMEGLSQLINRLEDTTALLRDQLSSVKKTLKGGSSNSTVRIIKPILPFILKFQILIVIAFQLVGLGMLTFDDARVKGEDSYKITNTFKGFLVVFQVINTIILIYTTYILSKKMKNGGLGTVMAQTYMTTILVFAGLYFTVYRFDSNSWEFETEDKINQGNAFVQYVRMLYLSVSSATLCGAANIQPKAWYITLVVCCQNIMNFVYFASILAQTIGDFNAYTVSVRHRDSVANDIQQSVRRNVITSSQSYRNQRYDEIPD